MAEPYRRNREAATPAENLLPETATPSSLGAIPGRSGLNEAARNVGSTMGDAAARVRGISRRLEIVPRKARELKEQIAARAGEARQNIAETTQEWALRAKANTQRARRQMVEYCEQNPMQVIAGVAGAAFISGIALRIWRSRD